MGIGERWLIKERLSIAPLEERKPHFQIKLCPRIYPNKMEGFFDANGEIMEPSEERPTRRDDSCCKLQFANCGLKLAQGNPFHSENNFDVIFICS